MDDQGALAGVAGVLIAPEAAESLAIEAEPMAADALASGVAGAGVVAIGVVVAAGATSSFLLQPASAARLNDSAAMNVMDRM